MSLANYTAQVFYKNLKIIHKSFSIGNLQLKIPFVNISFPVMEADDV